MCERDLPEEVSPAPWSQIPSLFAQPPEIIEEIIDFLATTGNESQLLKSKEMVSVVNLPAHHCFENSERDENFENEQRKFAEDFLFS